MKLTPEQIEAIKTKLGLSPLQTAQLRTELTRLSTQADQAADSFLAKIGKSKYTWLIIIGIIAAAWALGYIQH